MGKTQSIEREAQSNQNFQNYLESLHKQLEDKTNTDFEKNRKKASTTKTATTATPWEPA